MGLGRYKPIRPRRGPAAAVRAHRHVLHARIVQAEGDEHGIPVGVGIAIPRAIAGIAFHRLAILRDHVVFRTFRIPKLGLGNGDHILRPIPGQLHVRKGLLPDFCRFHIRVGIRIAGKAVGVLLQRADQLPIFIPAGFLVGMDFLAAEDRLLRPSAFLTVCMLLHAAGAFPGAIAPGGMDMIRVCVGAGQGSGVHRLLHRFKASFGVLMLHDLRFSADERFPVGIIAARIFFRYVGLVGVENDLLLPAGQLRRAGCGGFAAGEHLVPLVAAVGMGMGRFLGKAADQFPLNLIAALAVLVVFPADQHGGLSIARVRMPVRRLCRFRADALAALLCVAGIRVAVYLRHRVTGIRVPVGFHLRKRTPEIALRVIAGGIVPVHHHIRLYRTDRIPFLPGGHLGIAGIRMGVLRNLTLLFQCDGRQNEGVGRAEHHHRRQAGDSPVPERFPPMCL